MGVGGTVAVIKSEAVPWTSKGGQGLCKCVWGSARAGREKKRKTVAGFTVRKWMRTEHHIFQSNGDKQRGFGCLVREKKKEWKKPELKSLQRRLFAEKCQRSYYPICTVSTAKQTSLSLFNSLSPSACKHTSHYLLRVMDQNLYRNKRQRSI